MSDIERYSNGKKKYSRIGQYDPAYYVKYRNARPELFFLRAAKRRAKVQGLPFNLTESDIKIPKFCPVLGIPIFSPPVRRSSIFERNRPNSPSLDRIKPKLGYVKGNVRVVSWRANDLRSDGTAHELRLIADDLARLEDI